MAQGFRHKFGVFSRAGVVCRVCGFRGEEFKFDARGSGLNFVG